MKNPTLRTIEPAGLPALEALRDQTAFLWIWGWAEDPSSFADELSGAFEIALPASSDAAVAIGHRAGGDVWLVAAPGETDAAASLLEAVASAWHIDRLWLDAPLWRSLTEIGALAGRIQPGARHQRWYAHLEARRVVRGGRGKAGPAKPEEITALRALDAEQYGGGAVGALDYREMIERRSVWVCRDRKRLVCSLKLIRVGGWANISSVWTKPSDRRRGFARRLVSEVVERCWRDEQRRCVLNVAEDNEAALGLYDALGFERRRRMLRVAWTG